MIRTPIKTENICKTDFWGGTNVTKMFNILSPYEKTTEVWTASAHKKGETRISISVNEDITFTFKPSFFYKNDRHLFGTKCERYEEFPLLAKWIDANDNLSVQVHPDDDYARKNYDSYGKTEAWYIVSAKPGAQIIYGLKPGTTRDDLKKALEDHEIKSVLNLIPVKKGEIYYIPSGMVHSLLDGVIVYEIQQSSDLTFRLYDWDRLDENGNPLRALQVEEALNVINYEENENFIREGIKQKDLRTIKSPYFEFSVLNIKNKSIFSSKESFKLCSVLEGSFKIITKGFSKDIVTEIKPGESFILTANQKEKIKYKIIGEGTILITSVR